MQGILLGFADVIQWLLWAIRLLVFIHWILWLVGADPYNPIVRGIRGLVDPMLNWLRQRLPWLVRGNWDLTPLALILITMFLDKALVLNLYQFARRF